MSVRRNKLPIKKGAAAKQCTLVNKNNNPTTAADSELYKVNGLLKVVMDHMLETSTYPQEIFALGGAVSLVSLLIGSNFRTEDGVYANIYIIAIGQTGSGKDSPRSAAKEIASAIGIPDQVADSVASGPGLEDYLVGLNAPLLLLIDEFGKELQKRKSNGDDHGVTAILLKLYTAVKSYYVKRLKAGEKQPPIMNPFVSLYGTSTEEALTVALSEADAESGWLGRMLFLSTKQRRPRFQKTVPCKVPQQKIEDWLKITNNKLANQPNNNNGNARPIIVFSYSELAQKKLLFFQYKIDEELRSETLNPIVQAALVRQVEMTKKLSLISAVSKNPNNPIINISDVNWAIALMNYSKKYVVSDLANAIENGDATSLDSRRITKCLKIIQRAQTFNDAEFSRATVQGFMPKRMLLKKMRVNSRTLEDIISTLRESGEIAEIELTKKDHGINIESAYYI